MDHGRMGVNMKQNGAVCRFNRIFIYAHLLFSVVLGIYRIMNAQWYFAFLAFASFLFLLLPGFAEKLMLGADTPRLTLLIYLYCTLSFTIGMALQAYHTVPFYDKLLHTLSGAFFTFLGLICYALLKPERSIRKEEFPAAAVFSFSFSMMIAACWEIYEYAISLFTSLDPQNVLTTGVHDTMQDMIVCLAGTLLFLIPEYIYFVKNRKDLFMASYEEVINAKKIK